MSMNFCFRPFCGRSSGVPTRFLSHPVQMSPILEDFPPRQGLVNLLANLFVLGKISLPHMLCLNMVKGVQEGSV